MASIVLNSDTPYLLTPATNQQTVITNTDDNNDIIVGSEQGIYSAQVSGAEGGTINDPDVTVIEAAGGFLVVDGSWPVWGLSVPVQNPDGSTDTTATVSIQAGAVALAPGAITTATALITSGFALQMGLAVEQALAAGGISLVATPSPLYNIAALTPSPAILFGVNSPSWNAVVAAGVTGMTAAEVFTTKIGGPNNGYLASWSDAHVPVGVTIPVINFSPDVATTLSGANDARITAMFSGAPNGTMIEAYHEVNLKANGIDGPTIQALDTYLLGKIHAVNATLKVGRGLATSPVRSGTDPTPWITPGMDFYTMDGYQSNSATETPDFVFNSASGVAGAGTLNAFQTAVPGKPIGIMETGTPFNMPNWLASMTAYAQNNQLNMVLPYFLSGVPQSQPWSNSFTAAMQSMSKAFQGSSGAPSIGAGATKAIAPLNPSPVAGYAIADSFSYDILVILTAGASSTNPWARVILNWYDNDATQGSGAIPVAQETWWLPMGVSTSNGTTIKGIGPQRGAFLQVKITNEDTVACTYQVKLNSTSRSVMRDDWRWDVNGSPAIPGFTLAPDGPAASNVIAGVQQRSVAAGGTLSYLCSLYAGDAYVRVETNATTQVVSASLNPVPDTAFNGTKLFNELITGVTASGPGDFTTELLLPRAPCLLTFGNSDTVAHNVFAIITSSG